MITYKIGSGILNDLMKKLQVELHIPGYQYCGMNPSACREHDIAYSKNRDNLQGKHTADKILAKQAFQRVLAPDASIGEKAAAFAVSNIITAKKNGYELEEDQW